jgi:galactitol-specific phosphotransferase system IIB component
VGLTPAPSNGGDWEVVSTLQTNGGTPTSDQFLHTLSWGSSSFTCPSPSQVNSSAGQTFQGALLGANLVMFSQAFPVTFTGVTFPASGATTVYVSDLTPNTTYNITGNGTPATATSDTAGVLTFNATGTGSITIGSSGTASVSLTSITVNPISASVIALGTQQFTAACGYSDGSSVNCTSSVTWASSSLNVVTVNSSGSATGVGQGSANIIVTSAGIQGHAAVTVPAATLQSIIITPESTTVPVGNAQQFKATGTYSDSSTSDLTAAATWSSSNAAMATVNSGGMATGMATGSANILAISGNINAQAAVTVLPAATITFSPAGGTYTSAQSVSIGTTTPSATIYYTTNGSMPTTSSAVYSGPVTVSSTETVQAIAVASGSSTNTAGSATYTINLPAATPTFSPAGGTFTSAQSVTIGTTTPSATIYYTPTAQRRQPVRQFTRVPSRSPPLRRCKPLP